MAALEASLAEMRGGEDASPAPAKKKPAARPRKAAASNGDGKSSGRRSPARLRAARAARAPRPRPRARPRRLPRRCGAEPGNLRGNGSSRQGAGSLCSPSGPACQPATGFTRGTLWIEPLPPGPPASTTLHTSTTPAASPWWPSYGARRPMPWWKRGLTPSSTSSTAGPRAPIPNTGDGAGILMQIPDAFLRGAVSGIELPPPGRYGVGRLLPADRSRAASERRAADRGDDRRRGPAGAVVA